MIYILVHKDDFIKDMQAKSESKDVVTGNYHILRFKDSDIPSILDEHKRLDAAYLSSIRSDLDSGKSIDNKKTKNYQPYPFASKQIDGKGIFKRVHGEGLSCVSGMNQLFFTIPYPHCKITTIEMMNTEFGDRVSFKVLDSDSGMITGVPNYQLNQFGFGAFVSKDFYVQKSEYDADLYYGLILKVEYESISVKDIGINFILNEVK